LGLKVIGAGLGRTGTASLKVALEQLGIGRCHHMGEVLADPEQIPLWIEAADGSPDWDRLMRGFSASVDYPSCSYWRELAEVYPDAKIILSTRSAESWFESVNATIMAPRFNDFIAPTPWGQMIKRTIWDTLEGRMGDREFMIDYFERSNDEIQRTVPADRLLVFEAREGWAPLCDFLGLPVPDTEFPRINQREETKKILDGLMTGGEDGPDEETMAGARDDLFAS
jgi:hypothetical protein